VGGLLLDRRGERVCNEELYGASIADALARPEHGGRGWLIVDARQAAAARRQLSSETMGLASKVFGYLNLYLNHRKARSLAALGARCGMPAGALEHAVERYNVGAARGIDELGKSAAKLSAIVEAPYLAINVDLANPLFLTPTMTLGGLVTDALSGRVLRDDRSVIPGLYAVGRTAVGVASAGYVSGLSIADCVFSGRNAGADVASRASASLAA
jgi:3-oxo-5alpha-steroid 4-dehydrogenase